MKGFKEVVKFCYSHFQGGAESLQRAHGLCERDYAGMELWRGRHGNHSLEGSSLAAAGLPHHDQCSYGAYFHQVSARLDDMGGTGGHLCVGSVGFLFFCFCLVHVVCREEFSLC